MAFADILDSLRDSQILRPRNVVPALIALGFGVVAWVGIGPLLFGEDDPPPAPPVAVEAVVPESEPPPVEPPPEPEPPPVYEDVLVARQAIAAGSLVERHLIEWHPWHETPDDRFITREQLDVGGVRTPGRQLEDFQGALTTLAYGVGEALRADALVWPHQPGYLAGVLEPGFKAVAIQVDRATTSAGMVRLGDRVDVVLVATNLPGDEAGPVAQTLVRDVLVVAVDSILYWRPTEDDAEPPQGNTFTLAVRPWDATRLSLARDTGTLSLMLRSSRELASTLIPGTARLDDLVAPAAETPVPTLRVLRGTQVETVLLGDAASPGAVQEG